MDRTIMERYYLVSEHILPEAVLKTAQAKELLSKGDVKTIHEAVDKVGLSRSAFYKYRDGVFTQNQLNRDRIATISMLLEHRSGMLSKVLQLIASMEGNVLTIHQTIPLQGMANVVVTVETSKLAEKLDELVGALRSEEGVRRAIVLGQG
ncbi:ACT domain-containing protein [Paenibacillus sp. MBLB4367]|uniref:ACT domain-containing protein n=1 Tax=Paenibacillus sp. MBLB4367 TaxID=3384767 RepID=UPI003908442C